MLQTLGIQFIAARSFARIFFRNAINLGIPVVELTTPTNSIKDGDNVEVDLDKGTIRNLRSNKIITFQQLPAFLQEILDAEGALNWLKTRKNRKN
ncbi:MAG: 3-isopropylmalate dehydratase small subunit [Promethearchaeota archaeon CR_4]|nr:MAG: 3-isopropylmalate dehydratase small subunit [Candidatus Lokiarchaeota archaeon CR_4]